MQDLISRLPERFHWTIHNLVAHPLSEILYQFGFERTGNWVHDVTIPIYEKGSGRG